MQPTFDQSILFLPVRGNFPRGIFASLYTTCDLGLEEIQALYESFYESAPFTILTKQNPNLKQVVNTNKCLIYLDKYEDQVLIISMIDNLLKGASGQAVQNMNLTLGLPQTQGLKLKANFF